MKWAIVEEIRESVTVFTKILYTAIRNAGYNSNILVLGMGYISSDVQRGHLMSQHMALPRKHTLPVQQSTVQLVYVKAG